MDVKARLSFMLSVHYFLFLKISVNNPAWVSGSRCNCKTDITDAGSFHQKCQCHLLPITTHHHTPFSFHCLIIFFHLNRKELLHEHHSAVESHNGRYNPSQHRERYGYVDGIFVRDVVRLKLFFRKNAHIHMINAHDEKPLSKNLRLTCSLFRYHSCLVHVYCRKDPH